MAAPVAEEALDELFKGASTTPIWDDFVGTEIGVVLLSRISSSRWIPSLIDEKQLGSEAVDLAATRAGLPCGLGSHDRKDTSASAAQPASVSGWERTSQGQEPLVKRHFRVHL